MNIKKYRDLFRIKYGHDCTLAQTTNTNVDVSTLFEHKCVECDVLYKSSIESQLSSFRKKSICAHCFSQSISVTQNTPSSIKLRKKFDYIFCYNLKGIGTNSTFRCLCGREFKTTLKNLLKQKIGCNCKLLIEDDQKNIRQLIKQLTAKGIDKKHLTKFQPITYTYQSKIREYQADVMYRNNIIEAHTLEEFVANFERNKARAKACIKQGYKYKLFLDKKLLPSEWLKWKEDDVYKYLRKRSVSSLRILAFDPGSNNFAWSVLDVKRPFKVKLLATGMMHNTVKELTANTRQQYEHFIFEVSNICNEYDVDHIIAERFMHRPGIKGLTMELVNQMIGILTTKWIEWKRAPESSKLITASQWKNEWNRFSDLKEFYTKVPCTVHQVDSIGIGLYGAAYWFDLKPFVDIKKIEEKLIDRLKLLNIKTEKL